MTAADVMKINLSKDKENSCFINKCMELFKIKKSIVNVINLEGVIGSVNLKQGLTLNQLNNCIEQAFTGKNVKAVVLNINSPGGSPVQSELIAKRVMQISKKKEIPVLSFVEDIAASGGYWLACAGSEIIVAENSILGSLGVIFSGFGLNKAIERIGVERRVHTSGANKSLLDPFLPEKKEDIQIITNVQKDIYQNFKDHVHAAREGKLKLGDEEIFTGAIWSGKQAIEIGLADQIGNLYEEMERRFGENVEIRIVNKEKSWLKRKLSMLFESFSASYIANELIHKKFDLF